MLGTKSHGQFLHTLNERVNVAMKKQNVFYALSFLLLIFWSAKNAFLEAVALPSAPLTQPVQATVTAGVLNLRQGPSLKSPILSTLMKGDTVEIFGQIDEWYLVFNDQKNTAGLVHENYLKQNSSSPEIDSHVTKETDEQNPPSSTPVNNVIPKPISPRTEMLKPIQDSLQPTPDETKLLALVNHERKKQNLKPLTFDPRLLKTARMKARDMVQYAYFAHQSPTFGSPFDLLRQNQISFKTAGENIAGNPSIEKAFEGFMASEAHKKNMLNPSFQFIGIGIENSPIYGKILVQQYIS